jgi:hypothetical protein
VLLVIPLGDLQALSDEIDVSFAIRIPDGDFFWNACSTYTAFSNQTVYTVRVALCIIPVLGCAGQCASTTGEADLSIYWACEQSEHFPVAVRIRSQVDTEVLQWCLNADDYVC